MSKQYEIPEPPDEEVVTVKDESGRSYRRADKFGEYWYSEEPGAGRGTYAWHDLLFQRGPVREA